MQDRFNTLAERFGETHVPLVVVDREMGSDITHRALIMKSMTVRELRAEVVEKFAQEGALKSEYALMVDNQALELNSAIGKLRPNTRVIMAKVERQQAVEDMDIFLIFDDDSYLQIDKLPAVIGRSKNTENSEVEVNLVDQPDGLTVSRRHAELTKTPTGYMIRNLTDKPLYVNDMALTSMLPQKVDDGDIFRLGKVTLKLRLRSKEE